MDIEECFEEIKRKAILGIQNSSGIPSQVNNILEQLKQVLISKTTQEGVNFSSITEYIQGQFDVFEQTILNRIGENRKNKRIEDCIYDITVAKEKLEENINNSILEERKKEDEKDANATISKILGQLQYVLDDIHSHYGRILSARGFDERKIEDIIYDFKAFTRYAVSSRYENKIKQAFEEDNRNYQEFEKRIMDEIMQLKENKTNPRKRFEEDLKRNVPSLEEQRNGAEERKLTENEIEIKPKLDVGKSLPDDVLK